ncbi:hypothetical protein WJ96_05630 [Burkholderia ubonensis]|uniref:Uncharacterized protein n=1 Tax=Burkholderia ubonensis TaxID=101571 RepID=A0AAW3MW88_9BURK|nr:hypothetical protein [Burkholderia ubonensis]KVP75237.1 hypothetical protein WJ93_07425 [Burkholderia ubonensis]KVP98050.1 hypothetical protein WJ96_05630 [Burkholderia ubonensis]KVZ92747.1 hypothetical protein WL25_17290 [Burkholderia ubonensis]
MNFFTRIDFMTLQPGNKTVGFFFAVSVPALQALSTVAVTEEEWQRVLADARTRVRHAALLPEELVEECGLELYQGTAVPRYFWVNRMFGGSLGAQPEELGYISEPARAEGLGPELSYSPHNVDTPAQALVLMILVQTWSEWASGKLMLVQEKLSRKEGGHDC